MGAPKVFIDQRRILQERVRIMMAIQNVTYAFALLVSAIFILCAASKTSAQESANSSFNLKQIAPNVWAAIGPGGQSNAGFVVGDEGVAVIDTFVTTDADGDLSKQLAAGQLLAEIRRRTDLPVRFVINTHYHLDHVAGNNVFLEAGAGIVAQYERAGPRWKSTPTSWNARQTSPEQSNTSGPVRLKWYSAPRCD